MNIDVIQTLSDEYKRISKEIVNLKKFVRQNAKENERLLLSAGPKTRVQKQTLNDYKRKVDKLTVMQKRARAVQLALAFCKGQSFETVENVMYDFNEPKFNSQCIATIEAAEIVAQLMISSWAEIKSTVDIIATVD